MVKKSVSIFLIILLLFSTIFSFADPGSGYIGGGGSAGGKFHVTSGSINLAGGVYNSGNEPHGVCIGLIDPSTYDLQFEESKDLAEASNNMKTAVLGEYNSRIPKLLTKVYIVPNKAYSTVNQLAEYNLGTRELIHYKPSNRKQNVLYRSTNSKDELKPSDSLYTFITTAKLTDIQDINKLKSEILKISLDTAGNNLSKLVNMGSDGTVSTVNFAKFMDTSTEDKSGRNYLYLLALLYRVADQNWNYDQILLTAISNYVKNVDNKPPLIGIESAAILTYNSTQGRGVSIMTSSDSVHKTIGATQAKNMYIKSGTDYTKITRPSIDNVYLQPSLNQDGAGTMQLIYDTVKKLFPSDLTATTPINVRYSQPTKTFVHAQNMLLGYNIKTYTGSIVTNNDLFAGLYETLKFQGGLDGFNIAYPYVVVDPALDAPLSTHLLEIDPSGDNKVADDLQKLDKDIKINIKVKKTDDFVSYITEKNKTGYPTGYPIVKVSLTREGSGLRLQQSDEPNVNGAKIGDLKSTQPLQWMGNKRGIRMDPAKLLKFVKGEHVLTFTDNTKDKLVLPENARTELIYKSQVTIETGPGSVIHVGPDKNDSTKPETKIQKVAFIRGKAIPPSAENVEKLWTSDNPKVFAEVKHGTNILNEGYEVMAGVPTGEPLYFTIGGTTYYIEMKVKRHEGVEIKRTYQSIWDPVDDEYKVGDQAKTISIPGGVSPSSIDPHKGGSYSRTWTGSIPNKAQAVTVNGSGNVTATCPAQPDRTAYNKALSEANAVVSAIKAKTVSHKAASDGQTRSHTLTASITTNSANDPQSTSNSGSFFKSVTSGDPPTTTQVPISGSVTANPGGAGSYTITVSGSFPAHKICGPHCNYTLPMLQDTWTQKVKTDYMEITNVKVWKLDQGTIKDGQWREITGQGSTLAKIVKGEPSLFVNIAGENNSRHNRVRYSVETNQHDKVIWRNGNRTNKSDGRGKNPIGVSGPGQGGKFTGSTYTNTSYSNEENYHVANSTAIDKNSPEWKKFDEQRKLLGEVTSISDFLILKVEGRELPIMYFDKKSNKVQTQQNYADIKATEDEMWTGNTRIIAAKNDTYIHDSSYLGTYANPLNKFSESLPSRFTTVFDTMPAGIQIPATPTSSLLLKNTTALKTQLITNGEYDTGNVETFYQFIPIKNTKGVNKSTGSSLAGYSTAYNSTYKKTGHVFTNTPYSPKHDKVNDLIIHSPVSAMYAAVVPLPNSLDQRTTETKLKGGNLQEPTVVTEKIQKPTHPWQQLVYNDNMTLVTNGVTTGWTFEGDVVASNNTIVTRSGKATIYLNVRGNTNYKYYPDSTRVLVQELDKNGNQQNLYYTSYTQNQVVKTRPNTVRLKITTIPNSTLSRFRVYCTDVTAPFTAQQVSTYSMKQVLNPDWMPMKTYTEAGGTDSVLLVDWKTPKSGGEFVTCKQGAKYKFIVEGASGGAKRANYTRNNGTMVTATYTHTAPAMVFYYSMWIGGAGGNAPTGEIDGSTRQNNNGGYNGGGKGGGSAGPGGGGLTKLQVPNNGGAPIYIIAGGGGAIREDGDQSHTHRPRSNGSWEGENGLYGMYNDKWEYDTGGGGGGHVGGKSRRGDDDIWSYAGSSYVPNGLTDVKITEGGTNQRNGRIRIYEEYTTVGRTIEYNNKKYIPPNSTYPNGHGEPIVAKYSEELVKDTFAITEAPDSWYVIRKTTIPADAPIPTPSGNSFTPGNFILVDRPFKIYFPNEGDFYGDGSLGLGKVTMQRGLGYVDKMNTTRWTKAKYVQFDFPVIYKGVMYRPKNPISLKVSDTEFNFYLPLAAPEAMSAKVKFWSIATNSPSDYNDNLQPTNKVRYPQKYNALHSAHKLYNIDLVGRIGNATILDTQDFRFSNFFKQPKSPLTWLVENMVKVVDINKQNQYVGDKIEIRGTNARPYTKYLNTWGTLPHLAKAPHQFPLEPGINNVPSLRKQPLRLGYNTFNDIQTLGNYMNGAVQIRPMYYAVNIKTGTHEPLDVYMLDENGNYVPINKHGIVKQGWNPNSITKYEIPLNWFEESGRRMYSPAEKAMTEKNVELFKVPNNQGELVPQLYPIGNKYNFGNAQLMLLTARNRTLIGNTKTYGYDMNPGNTIDREHYETHAQRWHYTLGLPSTTVFVDKGKTPTEANIKKFKDSKDKAVVVALDIIAVGEVYNLKYNLRQNSSVSIAGSRPLNLNAIPEPIIAVISINRNSSDDLESSGTH